MRNFYRNPANGDIWEYTDQDVANGYVGEGFVKMTQAEIDIHLSGGPPVPLTAEQVRGMRGRLLQDVYDPGIMMALRAVRTAGTAEEKTYAEGKVSELDAYAIALTEIPSQTGFPENVIWPEQPQP